MRTPVTRERSQRSSTPPSLPPSAATAVPKRGRDAAWQRWISPVALLVLWQLGASAGVIPERLLPPPSAIAATGIDLMRDGTLLSAVGTSLQRVLAGFAAGAVVGTACAVVAGISRWGEKLVDPPLQMLRAVPILGLIPLFILWFGIGETPKITLVAIAVAVPLYINTVAGIHAVDAKHIEVARVLGLGRAAVVRHVVLPGALPGLLTGLRLSLGGAWLALIVAEQINADAGLGFMINSAREFLRTDTVVLGLVVYSLLGLATDALVRLLERRALSWRRGINA
ncbi:ABC transporter permease [Nocardiopsis gilva YIM 90087]|uniref:ABC transporter permease n=1 Tax=Nocardiopsis gilva YIM 90087 TaxID=1235441 RepID=A0A223S468_9ACTN|nr:ABC transporter permease [Nocardiopsis gilva YIM 90087]